MLTPAEKPLLSVPFPLRMNATGVESLVDIPPSCALDDALDFINLQASACGRGWRSEIGVDRERWRRLVGALKLHSSRDEALACVRIYTLLSFVESGWDAHPLPETVEQVARVVGLLRRTEELARDTIQWAAELDAAGRRLLGVVLAKALSETRPGPSVSLPSFHVRLLPPYRTADGPNVVGGMARFDDLRQFLLGSLNRMFVSNTGWIHDWESNETVAAADILAGVADESCRLAECAEAVALDLRRGRGQPENTSVKWVARELRNYAKEEGYRHCNNFARNALNCAGHEVGKETLKDYISAAGETPDYIPTLSDSSVVFGAWLALRAS